MLKGIVERAADIMQVIVDIKKLCASSFHDHSDTLVRKPLVVQPSYIYSQFYVMYFYASYDQVSSQLHV